MLAQVEHPKPNVIVEQLCGQAWQGATSTLLLVLGDIAVVSNVLQFCRHIAELSFQSDTRFSPLPGGP